MSKKIEEILLLIGVLSSVRCLVTLPPCHYNCEQTFTRLLSNELAGTGVQVQALCPSIVATEFHERMGIDMSCSPIRAMDPADVVQASLVALQRGEVICLPALTDPSLFNELDAVERHILEQGRANMLADRYKE